MKTWIKIIAIFTTIFSLQGFSVPLGPDPTSYPDVKVTPPPVLTLRSLLTGAPLENQQYGEHSEKNLHWELIDITVSNMNVVQFRVPNTQKCFTGGLVQDCQDTALTAFVLVPTDTGAFIIQQAFSGGACLASRGFGDLRFEQCLRGQIKSQDLPFLWALMPPFGNGKLLKMPSK